MQWAHLRLRSAATISPPLQETEAQQAETHQDQRARLGHGPISFNEKEGFRSRYVAAPYGVEYHDRVACERREVDRCQQPVAKAVPGVGGVTDRCRAREAVFLHAIDEHAQAVQRLARSGVRVHVDRDVETQERKIADQILRAVLVEVRRWLATLNEVREIEPVGVLALRAGDDARRALALWPERPWFGLFQF